MDSLTLMLNEYMGVKSEDTKSRVNTPDDQGSLMAVMLSAKDGDKAAFSLIYEKFFTPVFRYFYQRMFDKITAEDLAQTVFLKAFKGIHRFKDMGKAPLAYFFTIARNVYVDYVKSHKKDFPVDRSILENTIGSHNETRQALYNKDARKDLVQALADLPPDQADVLSLKFLHDLPNKEIASVMNITEVYVRKLQSRGLQRLRHKASLRVHL